MKITAIRTTPGTITLPRPAVGGLGPIHTLGLVVTRAETDAGLVGEHVLITLHGHHVRVLDEMVQALAPLAVGQDPAHTTAIWAEGWKRNNFVGFQGVAVMGLSAIDGALWDLRGKAAGLNIAALIGQARTAVPTYASGGLWLDRSIDELQSEAAGFVAAGFRAVKMRLAPGPLPATEARVRAVREAIGPDIRLMADANQQLTEAEAIRMGRMLEAYDLTWFEEPLPAWDLAGVARVAAALDTPIASGETEYARYGFRRMIELRAADVLMPDLQRVGGVTEFVRVAHLAAAYDVPVSSHLFPEMSLSVLAGLQNATYLEHMPWLSPLYQEAMELQDGAVVVPERPGWGFTLDRERVDHAGHAR
jgi:L-alanine-DL-glutamate epimerase-like enolase superfamily enzyme